MHFIRSTPSLLKKLSFLLKHADIIYVTPKTISSKSIQIELNEFCNFTIAIKTIDFIDIVKYTSEVYINGNTLHYTYESNISSTSVKVDREVKLLDESFEFNFPDPVISITLTGLNILTKDDITMQVHENVMVLESNGFIKTKCISAIEKIQGLGSFKCCVRGRSLKILSELEGRIAMSFFEDFLIIHEFDEETTTSVIIPFNVQ